MKSKIKNLRILAIISLMVGVVVLSGCIGEESEEGEIVSPTEENQSDEKYDVLTVYPFIDNTPTQEDIEIIKLNLNDSDCVLRKLSVAVLYKYDKSQKLR